MFKNSTALIGGMLAIAQYGALFLLVLLATVSAGWTAAALLGVVPWWVIEGQIGGIDAGIVIQSLATALLLGLCFFVPTNIRVMQLENSHRRFQVAMNDVARAYHAVHAADRSGVFALKSEYDSVRDRLIHLRNHPDLGDLEPEILELAAQMSHESRDLANIYSDDRVSRAQQFLRQRQDEATLFQERVQVAHSTCHELRRWLEKVEVEESIARAQLARLREDLAEVLPAIGFDLVATDADAAAPTDKPRPAEVTGLRSIAAE
jgi:hypothetical protein